MAVFDTVLTIFILLTIAILAYLKMTNKSIPDFIREIREVCRGQQEEVINLP